jgi:predicted ATPase/transcriptional regulator with XRE-family HTH domain
MLNESAETFGAALRDERERAGLTQEDLAERAGLSRNAISALERGERQRPFPHTVQALAAALGLSDPERDRLFRLARARASAPRAADAAPVPAAAAVGAEADELPSRPLPLAPNALLGRETERRVVAVAFDDHRCRLVTLSGAGGVGKSRLALQLAGDLAHRFADGVVWVELAPLTEAGQVAAAIAEALGMKLQGARSPFDQVCDALGERRFLLVLDNMEHLLDAAELLARLLASAPGVRLLVTSRERLRLAGEWVIDVPGLALADSSGAAQRGSAAVRLFTERAQQAVHEFALDEHNQHAVVQICRLVEGLPLGIELAAAWVAALTPAEIAAELARTIDLLSRASRSVPARHRSMRAVFDSSLALLDEGERRVFPRLCVFRGGWDRAAAHDVAGASLEQLATFVDASLVRRNTAHAGGARFELHGLLRQYAAELLDADPPAAQAVRDRHCAYYARRLGERTAALQSGEAYVAWLELAPDIDNIRAAWAWAVERRDHQAFAQMGQAIQIICETQGLFEEGVALFAAATTALRGALQAHVAAERNPELVWTLGHLLSLYGNRAARSGLFRLARDLLAEGYALLEVRGDLLVRSGTLFFLGYTCYVLGAFDDARAWFTRSIDLSQAHGDTFFLASSESLLAMTVLAQGEDDEALVVAEAALEHWRANGHPRGLALGFWALSSVLRARGDGAGAAGAGHAGLNLAVEVQDPWTTGALKLALAGVALDRSDLPEARRLAQESEVLLRRLGDPWSLARSLYALGLIAHAEGQLEQARHYFEETRQLADSCGLESSALDAQLGLALVLAADDPVAASTLLAQILARPHIRRATRERALRLEQAIRAKRALTGAPGAPGS